MSQAKRELRATPAQVLGPFFVPNAVFRRNLAPKGVSGDPVRISGQVLATDGSPISGATVHIWVADPLGRYDNQDDAGNPVVRPAQSLRLRGRIITDKAGRYTFRCLRPGNYPLFDEPVDTRPSHIHALVEAPGYTRLVTQLYFQDDGFNEHDIPREGFFQPELVVHMQPALPAPQVVQVGTFNFVLNPAA
jgi:hydroxyquinol 1,2-dioxygenase